MTLSPSHLVNCCLKKVFQLGWRKRKGKWGEGKTSVHNSTMITF